MTTIIGQSYLISSVSSVDLAGATVVIRYLPPSIADPSSYLEIPATVDLSSNTINALVTSSINNEVGKWLFWLYITYPTTYVYISKPIVVQVIPEGQI